MFQRILLYSGGMDSYMTARLAPSDYYDACLYIKTGLPYDEYQLKMVRENRPPQQLVVDQEHLWLGDMEIGDMGHTVPARNLYYVLLASYYADEIHLCGSSTSTHPDKDERFAGFTETLLNYVYRFDDRHVKVVIPYGQVTKVSLMQTYCQQFKDGLDELSKNTFSCYEPSEHGACGTCKACEKKGRYLSTVYNSRL